MRTQATTRHREIRYDEETLSARSAWRSILLVLTEKLAAKASSGIVLLTIYLNGL